MTYASRFEREIERRMRLAHQMRSEAAHESLRWVWRKIKPTFGERP